MIQRWSLWLAVAVLTMGSLGLASAEPQHEMATPLPPSAGTKAQEERRLAAAEAAAKQLLVLMDTDKSGKVSKQEWMTFMEKEFERLDVNKDGELDVKELEQSRVQSRRAPVGK